MDLLEIRKKAKEKKEAEAHAAAESATPSPPAPEKPVKRASKRSKKAGKKAEPSPPEVAEEASPDVDYEALPDEGGDLPEEVFLSPRETPPPETVEAPLAGAPSVPEETGRVDERPSDEGPGDGASDEEIVEYLAFMLAKEEYAVKVEDVKEIIRLQKITNVPRAPDFVEGIISLRGVIIPVFNIRRRLGLDETERTRSTRIVVVSHGGSPQGIIVDKVTGVARLRADSVEPPPAVIGGVEAEYLEGVGRLGDRLLILFNTDKALAMEGQTAP